MTQQPPEDLYVLILCAAHVALWTRLAARRSGAARPVLFALLLLHTHAWARAIREGRLVRGYRALCGRRVEWATFRVTEPALSEPRCVESPPFRAAGEFWRFQVTLNQSSYASLHIARQPRRKDDEQKRPPRVEVFLELGDLASEPAVHAFMTPPFAAGNHKFASHAKLRVMLAEQSHLTVAANVLPIVACAHLTQRLFAAAELLVLGWLAC